MFEISLWVTRSLVRPSIIITFLHITISLRKYAAAMKKKKTSSHADVLPAMTKKPNSKCFDHYHSPEVPEEPKLTPGAWQAICCLLSGRWVQIFECKKITSLLPPWVCCGKWMKSVTTFLSKQWWSTDAQQVCPDALRQVTRKTSISLSSARKKILVFIFERVVAIGGRIGQLSHLNSPLLFLFFLWYEFLSARK